MVIKHLTSCFYGKFTRWRSQIPVEHGVSVIKMKLKDIELTNTNHFIAMQYYGLILNRTYLVLITSNHLIGLVANGLVSVQGGDPLTSVLTSKMAVDGDLMNPLSYLKEKYLKRVEDIDLLTGNILKAHKASFKIKIQDITSVTFDPSKKWGMGYYPHDGKVYIITEDKKREFIILGGQSGKKIRNLILTKLNANTYEPSEVKRQ
jgi:hypothetical protein